MMYSVTDTSHPLGVVAVTTTVRTPVVVGVPEIVPVDSPSERPAGRVPDEIAQVAPSRPEPEIVAEYGSPTTPAGTLVVEINAEHSIVVVVDPVTTKYKVTDTSQFAVTVAVTVTVDVPEAVGTPETTPVSGSSVRPAGNNPLDTAHTAPSSPVPEIVAEYDSPTTPAGTVDVEIDAEHSGVVVVGATVVVVGAIVVVGVAGTHVWLNTNSVSGPFTVAVAASRVSAVGVNTYACLRVGCATNVVTTPAFSNVAVTVTNDVSNPGSTKCQPYW